MNEQIKKEVRDIIDQPITFRESDIKVLFNEFNEEIKLLKKENQKLREHIIRLKMR